MRIRDFRPSGVWAPTRAPSGGLRARSAHQKRPSLDSSPHRDYSSAWQRAVVHVSQSSTPVRGGPAAWRTTHARASRPLTFDMTETFECSLPVLARLLSDADVSEFVLYDSYVYVLYVYTHSFLGPVTGHLGHLPRSGFVPGPPLARLVGT